MHLVELHKELQQAQKDEQTERRLKAYVASARCGTDIASLTRNGWNDKDIAEVLELPVSLVKDERTRHTRMVELKRKFLGTGNLNVPDIPGMPAVYTIFQR